MRYRADPDFESAAQFNSDNKLTAATLVAIVPSSVLMEDVGSQRRRYGSSTIDESPLKSFS